MLQKYLQERPFSAKNQCLVKNWYVTLNNLNDLALKWKLLLCSLIWYQIFYCYVVFLRILLKKWFSDLSTFAWKHPMDEENIPIVYPRQIANTAKRPDITIYSVITKNVIITKLTVPTEENLTNAYARKKCKYQELIAECENREWSVYYFPVEVGSRGFYNTSLGVLSRKGKTIIDTASKTALRTSYVIWLCRKSKAFRQIELLPTPAIWSEGSEMIGYP